MIIGEYYKTKCQEMEYSNELKRCIEDACQYCLDNVKSQSENNYKREHPLMLLGKIQSGKTRAFTGLMALAFDNGFDYIFILTKNSKALVEQTYKRMRKEFKRFILEDKVDVNDIMKLQDDLTAYELEKKLIIVAKKQKDNLDRMCNFIKDYMVNGNKQCLVIDDEADTTGIGYEKIKDTTNDFDLRTVASEVNKIRGSLDGYVFVQVTATPYALYLQPEFDGTTIKPVKPMKTVLVPSGENYIGGEYYFIKSNGENNPGRFIFEEVTDEEQEIVSAKTTDRRRFKEEEILVREDRLSVFKRGIVNFIVGGCILTYNNINRKYSYVIHTAVAKLAHARLAEITRIFVEKLRKENPHEKQFIEKLLKESYDDLSKSVCAFGFSIPTHEELEQLFYSALQKGLVKVSIINSEDDINKYLDEDTGELRLRTPFSIFVGGQVLDRGITIPNMVGFYYGRNPKTMQQDTVMQHSRMFGYREKELLSITRFYTTRKIYENMVKITEIDMALREDIECGRFEDGVCFIENKTNSEYVSKIVPCSPNKIIVSNVVYLKPLSRILPVGFTPKAKVITDSANKMIDIILDKYMSREEKNAVLVDRRVVEEILSKVYETLSPDEHSNRFVSEEKMLSILRYISKRNDKCYILVRRNRQMPKYRENGTYIDAPDNGKDERKIAMDVARESPCLMLLYQKKNDDAWKNREFWWPILVVPRNTPKTIYALPDISGRIRKK